MPTIASTQEISDADQPDSTPGPDCHPPARAAAALPAASFKPSLISVGGEDAGEDRAQRSARAVHAEGIQRIVVAELALHRGHHEEAEDAGQETDQQRGKGLHETGGRRDGDQSRHAPEIPPSMLGLPCLNPFREHPAQSGRRGAKMGRDEGAGGQAGCGHARCPR